MKSAGRKRSSLQAWARLLKQHTLTVYFAARDPRTPLAVRCLALGIAAYALSPIDLIPDFIPIIGLLDDLILVPAALALVIRLCPGDVIHDARLRAEQATGRPVSYAAGALVVGAWIAALWIVAWWIFVNGRG